ncbi:MAG: helix-turn-helix transcriptional regulator [Oscillospiraceae bacterium]|nr:helix-turn-helix transcriptional regulator [Oscillospiraceae bacterium]
MNICINENIKKLRREKNITQEKLAEYLNVSIQAVSKWERNETLPDITMIIPIASYFNVSTDELLGVDAAKNEIKIQEYLKEISNLQLLGKWEEEKTLTVNAHKEFPNDFRITYWYIRAIINRANTPADVILAHADEITNLCERILDECNEDHIRNEAVHVLAQIKKAKGKVDDALELLDRLPDWYDTKGQLKEQLFDKNTDEWWNQLIWNFFMLSDFALNKLQKIIWYSNKPFDEKVNAAQKIIDYLLKILDETNCEMLYNLISLNCDEIGKQCYIAGKREDVSKYFDIGLSYAKKFDDYVASDRQFPFYTQKAKQNYTDMWRNAGEYNSMLKRQFAWYENNPWFEELRKTDSFNEMLEKYRPFAKDIN